MQPALRTAAKSDLEAVERVVESAYAPWAARLGRKPAPMLADYAALIATGCVIVADVDGRTQGVLVLIPQPAALLLDNVAVAPSAQKLGLGRRLLAVAEDRAREAGLPAVELYTNAKMTENIALYARLGYVETDRREEQGHLRVYMAKALS